MSAKKSILIIDDDRDWLETVRIVLTEHGYRVLTAAKGEEGLETAKREPPDLILLDVMLDTRLEGFRLSVEFSKTEETAGVPIVMLSGVYQDVPDLPSPADVGAPIAAFLEKPVPPQALLDQVRKTLGEGSRSSG